MRWLLTGVLSILWVVPALGSGTHQHHTVPTLENQTTTSVTVEGNRVILTFGPIDLPTSHDGELAASMPHYTFQVPKDMYLVGYKSSVFTKEGRTLPQQYLHHILMLNTSKDSVTCPGEPLFFAGAGLELTEARFPAGYGVKLRKNDNLKAVVAFYHKAPPTKDVMATFTMEMAPEGSDVQPMDVYQVGVNVVCYSKFSQRPKGETDEGMEIQPGVTVLAAPLRFRMDGCVKFAYPHGHDQLLLIALEDKTARKTLLRTVPDVTADGTFLAFQPHQVFKDEKGFPVTTKSEYEMTMVYHHPLHDLEVQHAMGNYLLYMTPGSCPTSASLTIR